jgi:hypothetical protein
MTSNNKKKRDQRVLMVDPPSGWLYGFPKPIPPQYGTTFPDIDLRGFLLDSGYPPHEVDFAVRYMRFWEQDI